MNILRLFINISVLLFFIISKYNPYNDHNDKYINIYNKVSSSTIYTYSRILKEFESVTPQEDATYTLDEILLKTEEDTNEEKCKGLFGKLKKKKEKQPKYLNAHNYYARKNKKKEEKRQYLKNNKDSLSSLQKFEEKLFTHADLLRCSFFSKTLRTPDGIFYT